MGGLSLLGPGVGKAPAKGEDWESGWTVAGKSAVA